MFPFTKQKSIQEKQIDDHNKFINDIQFTSAKSHIDEHTKDINTQKCERGMCTEHLVFISIDTYDIEKTFKNPTHDINLTRELLKDLLFFYKLSIENQKLTPLRRSFLNLLNTLKKNLKTFITIIDKNNKLITELECKCNDIELQHVYINIMDDFSLCKEQCEKALFEYKKLKVAIKGNKIRTKNYTYNINF